MLSLVLLSVFSLVLVSARDYTIMEPAYDPDWGEWNDGALCPDNTFAHGFAQKTDAWCSGGGECTGLNGLEMMCGRLDEETYELIIREYEGPFGDWHGERLCKPKEFLKQGQQNYQSYQGMWVDDAGCNGVSFICNNGTDLDAGADTHWVDDNVWTSFVSCPGDSLICGFQTKGSTSFPDNAEISRVRFYCCARNS